MVTGWVGVRGAVVLGAGVWRREFGGGDNGSGGNDSKGSDSGRGGGGDIVALVPLCVAVVILMEEMVMMKGIRGWLIKFYLGWFTKNVHGY